MHKFVIPKICHCWKKVADFLDCDSHKKKEIDEKHKGKPKECCSELMEYCLDSDNKATQTWYNFLLVLKDIEELKTTSTSIEKELLDNGLICKK